MATATSQSVQGNTSDVNARPAPSVAFVTKTYTPDLERCELLCRSIALLAPGAAHWLIVDSRDREAFRGLESTTTRLVTTEELLPRRVWRFLVPGAARNVWVDSRGIPMRGWIVQQLAKLAIALVAPEDILVHADSDIALIRPFNADKVTCDDGSVPLFRVPGGVDERLPSHIRWHRSAERLLGVPPRPLPLPDYIGGLVPWRRDVVISLLERIEDQSGRHWMPTLARARHFSEYVLYGRFVDDVLERPLGTTASSDSLCRCYWESVPLTNADLETFIDGASPSEVSVMVSAKAGMKPAAYADVFERRWAAFGGGAGTEARSPLAHRSDSAT